MLGGEENTSWEIEKRDGDEKAAKKTDRKYSIKPAVTTEEWNFFHCRTYSFFLELIYLTAPGLSYGTQDSSLLQNVGPLAAACKPLVAARGIQFPDQASNLGPLHWE